jgi:hypothetical protein
MENSAVFDAIESSCPSADTQPAGAELPAKVAT